MRRTVALVLAGVLLSSGVVLANGMGGDAPPSRIPIPAKPFAGTAEDIGGTRVKVNNLTWNGEVFVYGTVGEAQVTVPFEKVAVVHIEPSPIAEKRTARAVLKDGSEVAVTVDDDLLVYGLAVFGNYQIEVSKLRRLEVGP